MGLLEKTITKYLIDEPMRQREIDLAIQQAELDAERKKLIRKLANNHAYRLRLQNYRKKLREKERCLNEKELQLQEYEKEMKTRIRKTLLRPVAEEREKIDREIQNTRIELSALRETEFTIIDWLKRMERKERTFLDEVLADVNKIKKSKEKFDGIDFENHVAKLLIQNGYSDVQVTKQSRDYGADVLAQKDGIHYVFQCKHYSSSVGIEAIQEVFSAKSFYKAHIAVAVTNNIFTKAAKVLSEELGVILWDCEKLSSMENEEISCQEEKR